MVMRVARFSKTKRLYRQVQPIKLSAARLVRGGQDDQSFFLSVSR